MITEIKTFSNVFKVQQTQFGNRVLYFRNRFISEGKLSSKFARFFFF